VMITSHYAVAAAMARAVTRDLFVFSAPLPRSPGPVP
jgi:hypothetical protein